MAKTPSYQRFLWLRRAADLLEERSEEMARTISMEEGKILAEGRAEVARAVQTISLSGEEAKRIYGETIPLDANPTWTGQLGFTLRVPVGVVVAISPFNFPLNLVAHKVAPALAAGNSVIVKPASDTPLSALKLVEILLDAGVPAEAVQCLTGSGGVLGDALVADQRVRKVSFTGSRDIGEHIARVAGLKKNHHGAWFHLPTDCDARCRYVESGGSHNIKRVCQCGTGMHLSTTHNHQQVLSTRTIWTP